MNKNKGISLIVLVITIIVIIILAGAVILSLANNNPIAQANEASFKSNGSSYLSELNMVLASKYAQDPLFNPKTIFADSWNGSNTTTGTVKELLSSMSTDDGQKYIIEQGQLKYIGSSTNEKQWTTSIGMKDSINKSGMVLWLQGCDVKNIPQTTTWKDRSGSGNDSTLSNFAYTKVSGYDEVDSIVFDGVDDKVTMNQKPTVTSVTMSAWVNPTKLPGDWNYIVGTAWNWAISIRSSGALNFYSDTGTVISLDAGNVPLNTWSYVTSVFNVDTKTVTLYINGTQVGTTAADKTLTTSVNPTIGYVSSTYRFAGKMRNVTIYNRALTSAEITKNYNDGI